MFISKLNNLNENLILYIKHLFHTQFAHIWDQRTYTQKKISRHCENTDINLHEISLETAKHSTLKHDIRLAVLSFEIKKSLKIPKGQSESVNCRTDNTITKSTKGQTTICKTYI